MATNGDIRIGQLKAKRETFFLESGTTPAAPPSRMINGSHRKFSKHSRVVQSCVSSDNQAGPGQSGRNRIDPLGIS